MATRVALKMKEAFQQYSKKMCTRVTVFWMFYQIFCLIAVMLKPESATAVNRLTDGVNTVMIVNMGAYTANSGTEKVAIAFGKRDKLYSSDDEKETSEDKETLDEEENEEGNG